MHRSPGRARHKPSTTAQGRPCVGLHLYAAAASCSATFAQWTVGASRHPVFPAPSDEEGVRDEAKLGRAKPRGREAVAATQNGSCWRSSMPLAPSLRAQRSNPKSSMVGIWTASSQELLAMTWRERAPPPRSCARDAAQRSFSGALLSRSRCHSVCATSWLLAPGSRLGASLVRDPPFRLKLQPARARSLGRPRFRSDQALERRLQPPRLIADAKGSVERDQASSS
ncbi:hypothetical protein ABIB68_006384 [Bradyrhizobium sp. F1.2.2]